MKSKKKITAILSLTLALLLLAACGKTEPADGPGNSPKPTESPTPTETPQPSATPEPELQLSGALITGEELADYGDKASLVELNREDNAALLCLRVNREVKDFRVWELLCQDGDEGEFRILETMPLSEDLTLTQERPVVLKMLFDGLLPTRGVAFTDPDGAQRHFTLGLSGEDGSPVLTEFSPAEDPMTASYESIISAYRQAAEEGWDMGKMFSLGLSDLYASCVADDPRATVGAFRTDLDGDGQEELLICANSESVMYSSLLFDVFTMEEGRPLRLFRSQERDRYYWCGEEGIHHVFSSGAQDSGESLGSFRDGRFQVTEGVELSEDGWSRLEGDKRIPIDPADGELLLQRYGDLHAPMELTAF